VLAEPSVSLVHENLKKLKKPQLQQPTSPPP